MEAQELKVTCARRCSRCGFISATWLWSPRCHRYSTCLSWSKCAHWPPACPQWPLLVSPLTSSTTLHPVATLLQPHWTPCCHRNMPGTLLPQGFCTCVSFVQRALCHAGGFPDLPPLLRPLLKCLLSEASPIIFKIPTRVSQHSLASHFSPHSTCQHLTFS